MMLACMGGLMMIGLQNQLLWLGFGRNSNGSIRHYHVQFFRKTFLGVVSDKLGRKQTIMLLLGLTAVLSFA